MQKQISYVLDKLAWMKQESIWPNGRRYLWTDAFGVLLLISLYRELNDDRYLYQAEDIVAQVDLVLGRERGYRIGEARDRDGQYFHYLTMWMYALNELAKLRGEYKQKAVDLVREVHEPFVDSGRGVHWKMKEDLSGPYPGFGYGALDAFDGYVVYRQIDEELLSDEIAQMRSLVEEQYRELHISQDLGLGMMLWMTHFYPTENWAMLQRERALDVLDRMWIDPPGYFCRYPGDIETRFAFTNYGVSVGLQGLRLMQDRVDKLNEYFDSYRSGDEYDREAITHVMACSSHLPGVLIKGDPPRRQTPHSTLPGS